MTDFAGVIDTWDVVNEAVIMPVFDKDDNGVTRLCRALGQVGIVRTTFEAARAANPGATLLLNDFDVSPDYERLIEDCLEAGDRDRRPRHPVAHAPGLLGRGEDPRGARALRALRAADPFHREHARLGPASCRPRSST